MPWLFEPTTEPALSYKIQFGSIYVSTLERIEFDQLQAMYTRAYRVGDLANIAVVPHADEEENPDLVDLLVEFTKPARWKHRDTEGGQIRLVGDTLIVQQSESGHQMIVAFLNMLALAQEAPAFNPPVIP